MRNEFFRNRVFQIATRSANVNVNQEQLAKLWIAFPSVYEQEQIAEILDTVDDAIARTSSLIIKLKQTKAGLLQDLLTRGLNDDGKLRDPHAHPEQFKDSALGQIPREWKCETLQYCCKNPIRDFGSFSMTNLIVFLESGIPFLKSEMIEEENLNIENLTFISDK